MELPIKHKRGTTVPTANDLVVGEIAINTTTGVCYTKTAAGNVIAIGQDIAANWGNIGGDIINQTDLSAALDSKLSKSGGTMDANAGITFQTTNGETSFIVPGEVSLRANHPNYGNNPGGWESGAILQANQYGGVVGSFLATYSSDGNGGTVTTMVGSWNMSHAGIHFFDGTNQTTAAVNFDPTGYATETYVTTRGYLINGDNGTVPSGGDAGQVLTKASNSNYSFIWSTPIVYDRYLTTSATSNTVSNGAKTFTVGTGLSYTTQQDVTIAYDATHHMHAVVTSYNSGTGVLVVDVQQHTGTGTFTSWTVNVGGTVPLISTSWGAITGTLSNQTDLQTALDAKLNLSGGSMTGKLNCGGLGPLASLNLGVSSGNPTTTYGGDVWISQANLKFKDFTGTSRTIANVDAVNTFTTNQIVSASTTDPLLRLTQTGTGQALVIEDSTNPDTSAFIIDTNGNVGIGQNPSTWTNPRGYALETTGSVRVGTLWSTNSSTTPSSSDFRAYFNQDEIAIKNGAVSNVVLYRTIGGSGWPIAYQGSAAVTLFSTASGSTIETIIIDGKFYARTNSGAWVEPYMASGSLSGYALLSGATFTGKVNTTTTATTPSLNLGAAIATGPTSAVNGDIWITNAASPKLAYKTGGVNYYPAVANQFNTFSAGVAITGASATNPQLAVTQTGQGVAVQITTQTGSGHALVVEDQTSPDTDSFIINASGNVGIGQNPATWTPSRKLEVNGAISCSTLAATAESADVATTAHVKSVVRGYSVSTSSQDLTLTNYSYPNVAIKMSGGNGVDEQNLIIEQNFTQGIPIGTQYVIVNMGTLPIRVSPVSGVLVMSSGNKLKSGGQYSVITLIKTDVDEWVLAGELTA